MKRIGLLFVGILCLFITGCASNEVKDVKSLNDYRNAAISNGFSIYDKTNDYRNANATYITGALVATLDDIEVEMVIYDSDTSAEKTMNEHLETFATMKSPSMTSKSQKGLNFEKHILISNGYYMVTSRIENTLVFSKVLLKDKEQVEKLLKELGY